MSATNDEAERHISYDENNFMETSFENPRIEERRVRIDDPHGDYSNQRYHDREYTSSHHRTTSIHRNILRNQNISSRTIPRNLEERRKWVSQAATLNRQPLLEHAHKILEYMQQDSDLMSNDPNGEMLRREALRNMPQCLAVKKIIKRKFMVSASNNTKALGCWKMFFYQISIWFSNVKNSIRNLSYSYELWYRSLKEIEGNFGSGVSTYFKFLRRLFILNIFMAVICFSFIIVPQIVFSVEKNGSNVTIVDNNNSFAFEDIFTGSGYFTNTLMYYGYYTTGRINDAYSMPDAYFYTLIAIFLCNTIIIGVSMARSYRKNFIETMNGLQNVFAHKIFCGWDYGIATNSASNLRSSTIYTELRELLSDYMKSSEKATCLQIFSIIALQVTGHFFVFGLIAVTGYTIWRLLAEHRTEAVDEDGNHVFIITAVIINILMTLFPILFRIITSYEGYKSPRVIIFVTFLRTLLLEVVVVGILIIFWLTHSENQNCWENALGQEIYRLIVFDFFFSVVFIALFDVARYYIHKKWKKFESPEFDIAGNTFSVIYNQTLLWLGIYFAPMLCAVVILKFFLTWYVRSWILLGFCVPPKKSYRAAQTETLFLIITFLSSLILLFVHGYVMLNIPTSNLCGPFRDVDYTHTIFLNTVGGLDVSNNFIGLLNFIRKPGVIALVLIGMCMVVYYLRSKSISQRDFVSFLRRRLVLASQDKEFLLKHIARASSGDWRRQMHEKRGDGPDPTRIPPNMPNLIKLNEDSDNLPGTSSDDLLLTTSSTMSLPFSDISVP